MPLALRWASLATRVSRRAAIGSATWPTKAIRDLKVCGKGAWKCLVGAAWFSPSLVGFRPSPPLPVVPTTLVAEPWCASLAAKAAEFVLWAFAGFGTTLEPYIIDVILNQIPPLRPQSVLEAITA